MDATTPTGGPQGLMRKAQSPRARGVRVGAPRLPAALTLPPGARGLVVCTHTGTAADPFGSTARPGSGRHDLRRDDLSRLLSEHRLGTLIVGLNDERAAQDGDPAGDLDLLTVRMVETLDWAAGRADLAGLRTGLWATGVAAAAALIAATRRSARVSAVVSSSGRPDLAGPALARVAVPTLLIVGGNDPETLVFNRAAMLDLTCEKRLEVVPGAAHGFEEPGALEAMAHLAGAWLAGRLSAGLTRV